jgi:SAM-dependent methyltransferase
MDVLFVLSRPVTTMTHVKDSTTRFSDRVEDYIRYRPGYPGAIIPFLERAAVLDKSTIVADIGSGTGILTRLFLDYGIPVFGVEPNDPMREAASVFLKDYPGYTPLSGTAEQTGLPESCVDLIVAGQAFHWFEPVQAKREFQRISIPGGHAVLIWNERSEEGPFHAAYHELLKKYATDYQSVNHKNIPQTELIKFFLPNRMQAMEFDNEQPLDRLQLAGRIFSSSYIPGRNDPAYPQIMREIDLIYDRFSEAAGVVMKYRTMLYFGQIRNE